MKIFLLSIHYSLYRLIRWTKNREVEYEEVYGDVRSGFHISMTNWIFMSAASSYNGIFSFVLMGIRIRLCSQSSRLLDFCLLGLPLLIGYHYVNKMVYSKNQYLKFYDVFEKKDEQWKTKWLIIAICYVLCGWLSIFGGVFIMDIIVHLNYK